MSAPIISTELPRPQVCMAWDYDEWKRFHQQAQREAIERFAVAVEREANHMADHPKYGPFTEPVRLVIFESAMKRVRQQLQNEKV